MLINNYLTIFIVITNTNKILSISYNQPKLCSNASWNQSAITFANSSIIGSKPYDVFIDKNNTIYTIDRSYSRILIRSEKNNISIKYTSSISFSSDSIFVTVDNDIYFEKYMHSIPFPLNSYDHNSIDRWILDTNDSIPVKYLCSKCFDIFLDTNNNIYCSITNQHKVIMMPFNDLANSVMVIAGTGASGSMSHQLHDPYGIFVDINFNLYVADCGNDRIQKFKFGETNGLATPGAEPTNNMLLFCPTAVVLDADNYLFIVDQNNHRIVRSGPNEMQCIVGCSGGGSTPNRLAFPQGMAFDSYGNIYVADRDNNRIQKFLLLSNSCDEMTTSLPISKTETPNMNDNTISSTEVNLVTISSPKVLSYNQPKFTVNTTWKINAITLRNLNATNSPFYTVFVNTNDTVYTSSYANTQIQIWLNGSINPEKIIFNSSVYSRSFFVATNGDIYVGNGYNNDQIDKWTWNSNTSIPVMHLKQYCFGIFVDINDVLYCSVHDNHYIITKSLNTISNTTKVIAGLGCPGSTSYMLHHPYGIFVDINLDLYVADCGNDRVQLFESGTVNASTIAGLGTTNTISLNCPTAVVLDADNHVFIVDQNNHRIVASLSTGFRCIIGCFGNGSSSRHLSFPESMAFDSRGNIYVADRNNNRIQKFIVINETQTPSYNQPKFCSSISWNPNAITLTNGNETKLTSRGIFINTANTIYVSNDETKQIFVWIKGNTTATKKLSVNNASLYHLFVSIDDEGYINDGFQWSINGINNMINQSANYTCYGIFVDIINDLYCSSGIHHQVFKQSFDSETIAWTPIAGTNERGSESQMLDNPHGIFVDINFDLYVADCGNDRIQLFKSGQLNASTVAGTGAENTTALNCPVSIVLDGDKYLFIVDQGNHRIIRSGFDGFQCVVGCFGEGSEANQLRNPWSLSFDSYGNMFVADYGNNRIQKFLLAWKTCPVSYNRPKLCSGASWNSNATILASNSSITFLPYGIFINDANTIYATGVGSQGILIWPEGDVNRTYMLIDSFNTSYSIFVSIAGDIYIDNGFSNGQIVKYSLNSTDKQVIVRINESCFGLFVDLNNNLYCSFKYSHVIVKTSLNDKTNTLTITAGNGTAGSTSDLLNFPQGIFVDFKFDLYVADCGNNRIQLFKFEELMGRSVVGNETTENKTLNCPTAVILDDDGSLFIVDSNNYRIVKFVSDEFRCLIGCTQSNNLHSDQLLYPQSIAFDSHGNIYVTDRNHSRILKFILKTNSCNETTTDESTTSIEPQLSTLTIELNNQSTAHSTIESNTTVSIMTAEQSTLTTELNNQSTSYSTMESNITESTITAEPLLSTLTIEPNNQSTAHSTIESNTTVSIMTVEQSTLTIGLNNQSMPYSTMEPNITESTATAEPQLSTLTIEINNQSTSHSTKESRSIENTITAEPNNQSTSYLTIELSSTESTMTTERNIFTLTTQEIPIACNEAKIILIPHTSSLLSPLHFRRSQDFYIISNMEFSCNHSFSIKPQWTIYNCTTTCLYQLQVDTNIVETNYNDLYIPARVLPYGIYELKLTETVSNLSKSAFVEISPSGITANLVQLGTSVITRGHRQDLKLDPGRYSIDRDGYQFNASNWIYKYYCRIYGLHNFPNSQGFYLTIDDSTIDPQNPSCLSQQFDNRIGWQFDDPSKSSLTIRSNSLQSNRTYQFMVHMENRQNSSLQATGYLLVKVEESHPQMIIIGCVISTMCLPNLEFQRINPTTQVALFAICSEDCTRIQHIRWNIYYGDMNTSSNFTHWIQFNQTYFYENSYFFGLNTSNFTASNQLFLDNPEKNLWKFEVVYQFEKETSISALNFVINQKPFNGSCSIEPSNGTTTTLFAVSCPNWYDDDNIKDYSLYFSTDDPLQITIIAFSPISDFKVRLPIGKLNLIVHVRDDADCITEYNISSVSVLSTSMEITDMINNLKNSTNTMFNQNTVGQIIILASQELNQINQQTIDNAVSSGIPAASISISSLTSHHVEQNLTSANQSVPTDFEKALNDQADFREYLIKFTIHFSILTANSIKLQASALAQLTQTTNQLTRTTLIMASDKCYQLSRSLYSISTIIPCEDVQIAANRLFQCATNIQTAVNGPLQQRMRILQADLLQTKTFSYEDYSDFEIEWITSNLFFDKNIEIIRNIFYQKQFVNEIMSKVRKMISLLTLSINIHLNIEQTFLINTSQVISSFQTFEYQSLANKTLQQIHFPSKFSSNLNQFQKISLRSTIEPMASYGNLLSTNLSRSISLSALDENQTELSINTNLLNPIEIMIPREPNFIISPMILQNVTQSNQSFHIKSIDIKQTNDLTISVHFEIKPMQKNRTYLFIYQFDRRINWKQLDGFVLFCSSNLTNDNVYSYYIDNEQTFNHHTLRFGLRELNSFETFEYCSKNSSFNYLSIINRQSSFTANYHLRVYTSGCYYLDKNNQWKSDGLRVGPKTNHYQTQCLSTHL